ncbi:MAG: NrfD/PsrC family molybdoenzyme membrane anchor subunit [Planctomycetota bacterium]
MKDTGSRKLRTVKGSLWFIAGLAATITVARFLSGLGPVTNLTDRTPWGLWIGFDVLSGVALAAGGFVLAATVYVLRRERFRPLLRPAILTAFLGYVAVVVGLLYDLGRPWNIWRPMFFWQHHSVLFEVAWCVILYTTVLALEFAPIPLAESRFHGIAVTLKRATLPLVILGIMLSTLHQSSLGSLFLITPGRLHPLWYSPLLPILFLTSAVTLGLAMVTLESRVTTWLYDRKPEDQLLAGLMKPLASVLTLYALTRLSDLLFRGELGAAFMPTWEAVLFWFEIVLSAALPAACILLGWARRSHRGQLVTAILVVTGFVLHRLNVGGVSGVGITHSRYFPAWEEIAVTLGVVSGTMLVFFFFVERFNVYEPEEEREPKPLPVPLRMPLATFRSSSLLFVGGMAVAFALLPGGMVSGATRVATPVQPARRVLARPAQRLYPPGRTLELVTSGSTGYRDIREVLLLDGNRGAEQALFDHQEHVKRIGGEAGCATCHHLNRPNDRETSCSECHRDMYLETDIFRHSAHVQATGGNGGCSQCHATADTPKARHAATPCMSCHRDMLPEGGILPERGRFITPPGKESPFLAPGSMQVMHGLCLRCHEEEDKKASEPLPKRALCSTCHGKPVDLAPRPAAQ